MGESEPVSNGDPTSQRSLPTTPPRFVKCGPIEVSPTRRGGYWGACPGRGCLGYVSERDSEAHRLRELSAYAISVTVLAKIDAIGVDRVFILETDTGIIYEFRLAQFLEEGEALPDKYLYDLTDPQRFARTEFANGRWEDERDRFYLESPVSEAEVVWQ